MTTDDWLLDADASIRWRVLRDLIDADPEEVATERARVAVEGWGADLLALQDPDGTWDGGTYRPGWVDESKPFFDAWTATHFSLQQLREFGLDPDSPQFTMFSYPTRWYYDVLRALEYVRASGDEPDDRCAEAIELVAAKRDDEGRWPLENTHQGPTHIEMEGPDGFPSRWNTLRARRVLQGRDDLRDRR